jgi:cytochrome c oxidase cbb3-type subunit III
MKRWPHNFAILSVVLLTCVGCSSLPGRPSPNAIPVNPDDVTDFTVLYEQNCSGCHGRAGQGGGPALSLADPVYLAIADESVMKKVAANGIAGTSMAAFAKSAGGLLTNKQVDLIVEGIRQRYAKPNILAGITPPPYAATKPGDSTRGTEVYKTFCASCHGPVGKGGAKASSIVNGSFLALLTDQELRTLTIVGRPDLHAPDWRNDVPGKPMSDQDISDVVAWLASQRPKYPGRPFAAPTKPGGEDQ